MGNGWYETARICTNGHVINAEATSYPEVSAPFCHRCGSPVLSVCRSCYSPIRGEYHISGTLNLDPYAVPAYCHQCGTAYPWTEQRLQAALALAGETERLTRQERLLLRQSITDLAHEGPRTQLAIIRFRYLVGKAGEAMAQSLREIMVDVVSEAVKKAIWG